LTTDLSSTSGATVTLYAKWTAITYTIAYSANSATSGTAPANQTKTYGTSLTLQSNSGSLARTGYSFAGWNTASDGSGTTYAASASLTTDLRTTTGTTTLYAKWNAAITTPDAYRETETISVGTVMGSESSGAFISGRTVTLSPYQIAKYETTYELWYEVKTWANANGYTLESSAGREGNDGTTGAVPTTAKTEPVTRVSWRDAIVWCNAYSEMAGKTPVYYSNTGCTTLIKSLSNNTAYMKADANGYRLPTEAEWEAAARGGNTANTTHWAYTYAGSDTIGNVAWYSGNSGSTTHTVGRKAANLAGLYDMSGNVCEWCWDWYGSISTGTVTNPTGPTSGPEPIYRGGAWNNDAHLHTMTYRDDQNVVSSGHRGTNLGFRVACKAE
jgi:uncharacterized repeat protein (TIGR02543 family)